MCINAYSQADSNTWSPALPPHYSFIHYDDNVIGEYKELDSFYYKLVRLHHSKKGRVNIIHIGDSHTQADGVTSVVRNGLQDFFGDAGRGLVFPYQLANSNAPHDIKSSSASSWKSNRLTSPDKPIKTGISGYGIHSSGQNASVHLGLKDMDGHQERFNRMVFFVCNDNVCYKLTDSNLNYPVIINSKPGDGDPTLVVNTDSFISSFQLSKVSAPTGTDYSFYGVSLEKRDSSGVLYHTIGVNGARYDQFLQNTLFWQQLKALQGDLFIVSLGTNEAQNPSVNEQSLMAICDSFVKMIHTIAPHAAILITTPAGSYYKKKKPNKSLQNVTDALLHTCNTKKIAYWDLLHISGGVGGATAWKKSDLISQDLVHYNNAGYLLQGSLLLNALAKGYNNYEKTHPYRAVKAQPKEVGKPKTVKTEVVKATITPKPTAEQKAPPPQVHPPVPLTITPDQETVRPNSNIKVEYSDK